MGSSGEIGVPGWSAQACPIDLTGFPAARQGSDSPRPLRHQGLLEMAAASF
jgi:hypothetical protein